MNDNTQHAGNEATKNGCTCGGRFKIRQQTFGYSQDDCSMADFLCYQCQSCKKLKFVTVPQRQYTDLAKSERNRLNIQ